MNSTLSEFEALLQKAEAVLTADPTAEQAIVVQTAGGAMLAFANHNVMAGDRTDENAFMEELAKSGDTQIARMVCLWQAGLVVDLPSMTLRKALVELDPGNRETNILLRTGEGYATRTVGASM